MKPLPHPPGPNRRASARRPPKRGAQVACYANALGLGPNVARALLDISETGAHLAVGVPLLLGQEVAVYLSRVGGRPPVQVLAEVIWCDLFTSGGYEVGVQFSRPLAYPDYLELGQ